MLAQPYEFDLRSTRDGARENQDSRVNARLMAARPGASLHSNRRASKLTDLDQVTAPEQKMNAKGFGKW